MNNIWRDYKTVGHGEDGKSSISPSRHRRWPLLTLRALQKTKHRVVSGASDLLNFAGGNGNQEMKYTDFKILTALSNV